MEKRKFIGIVRCALDEDIKKGDVTIKALAKPQARVETAILAKSQGIVSGMIHAKDAFFLANRKITFSPKVKDGGRVKKGQIVARIKGPAKDILKAERTALNFIAHLSGIATYTNEFVKRVKGHRAKIMDTRKTHPCLRESEKYAVRCGGGFSHRMGLYDQILIKDNHIKAESKSGRMAKEQAIRMLIKRAKKNSPRGIKVEVEVSNLTEFRAALAEKPDIIMLDNMSISDVRKAVKLRGRQKTLLEASGNVMLDNVRRIASTGVDRISVGAITHSSKALDISLEIL